MVLTGLRDCQHLSPPSPRSPDQPPPSLPPPPPRADSQSAAVTRTANSSGRHSPRRARSSPRCWRTPSCPRSPTWLRADGGRLSRRETIEMWRTGENEPQPRLKDAGCQARSEGKRTSGEESRCSLRPSSSLLPSPCGLVHAARV